jgi:hypothetical protein
MSNRNKLLVEARFDVKSEQAPSDVDRNAASLIPTDAASKGGMCPPDKASYERGLLRGHGGKRGTQSSREGLS